LIRVDPREAPAVFHDAAGATLIDRVLGVNPIEPETLANVRFGAHNGLKSDIAACLKRAISGLMHRSKGLFDDLVGQREQH
jgi:hypothetical protein